MTRPKSPGLQYSARSRGEERASQSIGAARLNRWEINLPRLGEIIARARNGRGGGGGLNFPPARAKRHSISGGARNYEASSIGSSMCSLEWLPKNVAGVIYRCRD